MYNIYTVFSYASLGFERGLEHFRELLYVFFCLRLFISLCRFCV